MTLRHLKIFITVFETLNFTQAGKKLLMAQPAISLAIKELEEYYGIKLFERIRHTITPTQSGKQLYLYAHQILSLLDEMDDYLKDWNASSTIRIGSSITIGNYFLPSLVRSFKEKNPQVDIKVTVCNANTIENYILQNKIDFALIECEPDSRDITSIPFMQDKLCTIAHDSNPLASKSNISLHDLKNESFLMREKGSSVRALIESIFLSQQIPITPTWESTSTQALISAVQQNLGIATLPSHLIKNSTKMQHVTSLDIPQLNIQRNYNIVYYKDKYLTKAMNKFIELCQSEGNLK